MEADHSLVSVRPLVFCILPSMFIVDLSTAFHRVPRKELCADKTLHGRMRCSEDLLYSQRFREHRKTELSRRVRLGTKLSWG